jgi:phosphotransferase family enzyme
MSFERDWIMEATNDLTCREAEFAMVAPALPPSVRVPSLGCARDGSEYALLMRDITADLVPPDLAAISEHQLDQILLAMAQLHAAAPPSGGVSWCGLRERVTLLTPTTARTAEAYGAPVAADIKSGWKLFHRHASARVIVIIDQLFADPAPLVGALDPLPPAFLHGDLKLDNIGLDEHGGMWLIDWAMTLVAPAAVDLGWFLAINSRRLPVTLDEVMARYAAAAHSPAKLRERHDALTVLCGLLLRGWRKALDAEGGEPDELRWWCHRAREAARFL